MNRLVCLAKLKKPYFVKVGFFVILLFLLPIITFGQIKIEDVGDGWKNKVSLALENIKKYDTTKYNQLLKVCNHISFWNGQFSTTEDDRTILISQSDMNLNLINNISAVLIHESYHLFILQNKIILAQKKEEQNAYLYELNFLIKIPNIEPGLLKHSLIMIKYFE